MYVTISISNHVACQFIRFISDNPFDSTYAGIRPLDCSLLRSVSARRGSNAYARIITMNRLNFGLIGIALVAGSCLSASAQEPEALGDALSQSADPSESTANAEAAAKECFCQALSYRRCSETQLAVYGGSTLWQRSDVQLSLPGTNVTYRDVSWHTDPFSDPPYYGVRLTHFFGRNNHWGVMLDFTHNKMIADFDTPFDVVGTRNGQTINGRETIRQSFSELEFTNGMNFLTANVVYRGFWLPSDAYERGRIQPYLGLGLGAGFPFAETQVIGGATDERYQWRGPAFQALGGAHFLVTRHISIFVEYKFNAIALNTYIPNGNQRVIAAGHQLLIGPSLNW